MSGVATAPTTKGPAESVFEVKVTNKRWDPSNINSTPVKFEDHVWLNVTYKAVGLKKPARSFKGVMKFCDLFDEPRFQVRLTVARKIKPDGRVITSGVGMKFNQFLAADVWLRNTDLDDMTVKSQVTHILYADGTTERFGS